MIALTLYDPAGLGIGGYRLHWSVTIDAFTLAHTQVPNQRVAMICFGVAVPSSRHVAGFALGTDANTDETASLLGGLTFDNLATWPAWLEHQTFLMEDIEWGFGKLTEPHAFVTTGPAGFVASPSQMDGASRDLITAVDLGYTATVAGDPGWWKALPLTTAPDP